MFGDDAAKAMMDLLSEVTPADLATRADLARVESSLGHRMDSLDERMDRFEERMDRFDARLEKFDDRLHDLHGAIREQTRHYILACSTSMFTVGALAFAAARLV